MYNSYCSMTKKGDNISLGFLGVEYRGQGRSS